MLENITSPQDIKRLSYKDLKSLSDEIREEIISTVSKNGGHLASNLGAVELTVALHKSFDCPNDKLIFDVGHQCYTHKLLTGRFSDFSTIRQFGGLSGFTNREESGFDALTAGHSGPSLSAALGIARAEKMKGSDAFTVCIIGDGSFTNGMIYEALNNCVDKKLNLIIVLNDNEMSISPNVGILSRAFRKMRSTKGYFSLKAGTKSFLSKLPLIGKPIYSFISWIKKTIKKLILHLNFFELLGLEYIGPVDGHDMRKMELAFAEAKSKGLITILHIKTKKGKGYPFAENSPEKFHGISPFDCETGLTGKCCESFSDEFGKILTGIAEEDEKVCAITAAMAEGTGLNCFKRRFPSRFFDVGIAEEHAVTFSGGLSLGGFKPVCVLYSTFAQRVFDQLMHDITLQKLPLILCLDRAGIVPGDGATHQGIFDISLFSSLPNTKIIAPETFEELDNALSTAVKEYSGLTVIRYPKGKNISAREEEDHGDFTVFGSDAPEVSVITYGRMTARAEKAAALSGRAVRIIKLKTLCPLDLKKLSAQLYCKNVVIFDEAIRRGGVGEAICAGLKDHYIDVYAIDDYLPHGDLENLYALCGFSIDNMAKIIAEKA